VRFQKLRLTGFKSFVEPTELLIEPGLTGIVGPNGCGKSNLVEALRWVMGESSAKQMRGNEMDDVIFGGTSQRQARSFAEVVLHMGNHERLAPAAFNDADELEVSRRIARGDGSTYRVNGKEVRARDVQLLFADASTGARSTAMVSQGQIGAFIAAKPEQRRSVLEEAAGIGGLYSRRHEAELRLRSAESNLDRLDDVVATLERQLEGLKKQVRQASRYRRLSDLIRKAEAALLQARWLRARAVLVRASSGLRDAEAAVAERLREQAAAANGHREATARVPPLRTAEHEKASALQKLTAQRDSLAAEERRAAADLRASAARLAEIERDLGREQARAADGAAALSRLAAERDALTAAEAAHSGDRDLAATAVRSAEAGVAELEGQAAEATTALARADADRAAAARTRRDAEDRLARVRRQHEQAARDHAAAAADAPDPAVIARLEATVTEAEAAVAAASADADAATQAVAAQRGDDQKARDALQRAETALARKAAEEKALASVLAADAGKGVRPVVDDLDVEQGWEAALGAALGDDLTVGTDPQRPTHWRGLDPLDDGPSLPAGAEPLAAHVRDAGPLVRRLGQVGIVGDAETAAALQAGLRPGQRLVTRDGGMWRWDGLTLRPGAPTAAARRLEQRNQLAGIRAGLPPLRAAVDEARAGLKSVQDAAQAAAQAERTAREAARAAQASLDRTRRELAELQKRAGAHAARVAGLEASLARVAAELAEAEQAATAAAAAAEAIPDPGPLREQADRARTALATARDRLVRARGDLDRIAREADTRRRRLQAIAEEERAWHDRGSDAGAQTEALQARRTAEAEAHAALLGRPEALAAEREALSEKILWADSLKRTAAEELKAAEAALAAAETRQREAETALASGREDRIRAEAALEQARGGLEAVVERIRERLDVDPEALTELSGAPDADIVAGELPAEDEGLESRLEKLVRERETMGPVNLRAEVETEELTEQLSTIRTEREDVLAAIAKLRRGIGDLNREGRARLVAAFEQVNAHFQELFVRMFGGGRAHLALTGSEDPLEAGLEIMASPPGKKLQSLSLLSGGERALTALSLLFAVFLTNPAPVCVLDEVDAPLDDANVDRFCTVIEEIAGATATRFLLITHHRLTMARMHRLFGVTMAERGVSQLVSVDLGQAPALQAAE
jgi:chromosome segregation protein